MSIFDAVSNISLLLTNIPLLTAVDEEGGNVVRVSSNPNLASSPFLSPRQLYQSGGFDLIKEDTIKKSKLLNNLGLNLNLAPGIGDFIASKISSSIREIEGALNRIYAHTILTNELPTLSNIRKILVDILAVNTKPLSIDDIKKVVAEKWGVSVADINSERKQKEIVIPRQIAMYIAKNLTSKSLPEIGKNFGGRDHATVIYAVKKVKELMLVNPKMEVLINDVEKQCSAL